MLPRYLLVNVFRSEIDEASWTGILLHIEYDDIRGVVNAVVADGEGTPVVCPIEAVKVLRIAEPFDFPWPSA